MSLGSTGSSAGNSIQFPSDEETFIGFPSIKFFIRNDIIILCLSIESGFPGPNGSSDFRKSVEGFVSPPVPKGHIHSNEPEELILSLLGNSGCDCA